MKEGYYEAAYNGTISKMEEVPLSETINIERGSAGRKNLDSKRIWQAVL